MAKRKVIPVILIILSLVFLGCVGKTPVGTPTPAGTPTATPTQTERPTVVPTTPVPTPALAPQGIPSRYTIWMDSDYGFYKAVAARGNESLQLPSDFNVLNFSIRVGDRIRWINDDSYDFPLTLVSDDGLWTGKTGYLRYQGQQLEYAFNKTGTYTFSIKEYPRIPRQKVTVNP